MTPVNATSIVKDFARRLHRASADWAASIQFPASGSPKDHRPRPIRQTYGQGPGNRSLAADPAIVSYAALTPPISTVGGVCWLRAGKAPTL